MPILERPFNPILLILTIGWPLYYAVMIGLAFGMAWVAKGGRMSGWPDELQRRFPALPIQGFFKGWLTFGVRFTLIAFPLLASAIGIFELLTK